MRLLLAYIALTVLLLLDVTLYLSKEISLSGFWPDKLLFWTWIALTIFLIGKNNKKKWTKVYIIILIVITVLTMIPMMIPFLTIVSYTFEVKDKRYKINDQVQLQEFSKAILGPPDLVVIKSFGIYERIIGKTNAFFEFGDEYLQIENAESIRQLNNESGDSLKVEFKFNEGIATRTIPVK
jgi:hypothetical protein